MEKLRITKEGAAVCKNGHSYDRAKEGYYNLLLSSSGSVHGDNAEMVTARREFLDSGAYQKLAKTVSDLVLKYMNGKKLLDIGCGEGYYTDIIEKSLRNRRPRVTVSGFDISKDAVRRAAKRNDSLSLTVASAYHMPIGDGVFNMAVNMFSPLAREETYRVLSDDGIFIMAIPGEKHLYGLKKVTYEKPYKNEVGDTALEGFTLLETVRVAYTILITTKERIRSLFMMTPYAYRTRPEDKERVLNRDYLDTEVEFLIFVYKKNSEKEQPKEQPKEQ